MWFSSREWRVCLGSCINRVHESGTEVVKGLLKPLGVSVLLVAGPVFAIADCQVVGVKVNLEVIQSDLESSSVFQMRMTGAPVTIVVTQVQVDLLREKVERRFDHVTLAEHFADGALLGSLLPRLLRHPRLILRKHLNRIQLMNCSKSIKTTSSTSILRAAFLFRDTSVDFCTIPASDSTK
jgi:hypothetical protein